MKYTIITALILIVGVSASAQKLPSKVTITLTDKQLMRIDSAINIGATWTDSKGATNWYMGAFSPFYEQVRRQIDTTKVKKP